MGSGTGCAGVCCRIKDGIARFDHSFERGVEQAKANYTQNADGTLIGYGGGLENKVSLLAHEGIWLR